MVQAITLTWIFRLALLVLVCDVQLAVGNGCVSKSFNESSSVCKCNSTYCDTFPELAIIPESNYTIFTSSMNGARFSNKTIPFSGRTFPGNGRISVNRSVEYQSIIGFGGAITDAAALTIYRLSNNSRQKLLESYYSSKGIEYTLARLPIASCDFSTHAYSYDDVDGDLGLKNFSLAEEDLNYKIPIVKSAQEMSRRKINLFSSPWSAPYWMKTSNSMIGRGFLKGKPGGSYYKSWANYLVKFLDEYKKQGIEFFGMTAQNEPLDGRIPEFAFQCMGFTSDMQRDFIATDLGPALHAGGYQDLKLMILDDSTLELPGWAKTIFSNSTASKYISGVGVHWYMNSFLGYKRLTETHNVNPNKFILATEACAGSMPFEKKVILGDWGRAEQYTHDIIQDLQNWVTGWTDWNIALNMSGGPNWVNNNVDSPIIVNTEKDEFYKQPMYYAMGHFSKFLTPGSIRHDMVISGSKSTGVVFSTPEKYLVMILHNGQNSFDVVDVIEGSRRFSVALAPRTINTVVWNL